MKMEAMVRTLTSLRKHRCLEECLLAEASRSFAFYTCERTPPARAFESHPNDVMRAVVSVVPLS